MLYYWQTLPGKAGGKAEEDAIDQKIAGRGAGAGPDLSACGGQQDAAPQAEKPAPEPEEEQARVYTFGETITTENGLFTFTPVFEGFAEELANCRTSII